MAEDVADQKGSATSTKPLAVEMVVFVSVKGIVCAV
jgi:hypothetical protein